MPQVARDMDPIAKVEAEVEYAMQIDTCVNVGKCASTGKEITICYNAFGNPMDPCLLLIQGIGTSLLGYTQTFVEGFVKAGFYVIRYDNRDVGKSTQLTDCPAPALIRYGLPACASIGERVPYTLEDMADDGMRLLTSIGIGKAHVFGMSMGGMIAQLMAIRYPERVLSLNVHMTHVGGRDQITPSYFTYMQFLNQPRSNSPEDRADHMMGFVRYLGQGQYDTGDETRRYFLATYKRDGDTGRRGLARQIAAVMRDRSRLAALKNVTVPALAMHGALDPLIPVANGYKLAQALPNSKLVVFPHCGHDFPAALHQSMIDEVVLNMRQVPRDGDN